MSERLSALRPQRVVRALEKAGWYVVRQKSSHLSLHKPGAANVITVPLHRRDVPRGTLYAILGDAGLTVDEFLTLL